MEAPRRGGIGIDMRHVKGGVPYSEIFKVYDSGGGPVEAVKRLNVDPSLAYKLYRRYKRLKKLPPATVDEVLREVDSKVNEVRRIRDEVISIRDEISASLMDKFVRFEEGRWIL